MASSPSLLMDHQATFLTRVHIKVSSCCSRVSPTFASAAALLPWSSDSIQRFSNVLAVRVEDAGGSRGTGLGPWHLWPPW